MAAAFLIRFQQDVKGRKVFIANELKPVVNVEYIHYITVSVNCTDTASRKAHFQ